ncbi:hypothetical protein D9611_012626 [Ephemerocybe angulata]|uniref:Uncharacterized protein n=1 Tax=Ephemerocybe angulata TaxID=980116 RepID=A0A8H5AUV2_9AGAR|nr:hypothetical protein D9611_012626 [Tulosesus angulatus]
MKEKNGHRCGLRHASSSPTPSHMLFLEDAVHTTSSPTASDMHTVATSGPISLPAETQSAFEASIPVQEPLPAINPFSDLHSSAAAPATLGTEDDSMYEHAHSHHSASAHIISGPPSVHSRSQSIGFDIKSPENPPQARVGSVQDAIEHLTQALEAEAERQTDRCAKGRLQRKARKLRKKAAAIAVKGGSENRQDMSAIKNMGYGLLMFVTVPLWATGVALEATGMLLNASGMVVNGAGNGFKKMHTATADKLNIKV